ncbi:MAG: hypothetical protein JHC95_17295 [Solirubrobacteraceae bacterium]|nr:hypothetical protein [Solirubrobacteraceae bacterium]
MLISLLSTAAVIAGLFGVIPQIISMLHSGSSAGQSAAGWTVGISVNAIMGYVNLVGLHATTLALGNAVAGALCGFALLCVVRLADGGDEEPVVHPEGEPVIGGASLLEMPTTEFQVVRAHVQREHARRFHGTAPEDRVTASRRSLRKVVSPERDRIAA